MIYIIVPVHNRKNKTKLFLESLGQQNYKKYKVIIIDDGSKDGTSEMIINNYHKTTKIIRGYGNLWWTKSINIGIRDILPIADDEDFILLLNNDLVLHKNYLDSILVSYYENINALIGSITMDIDNVSKIIFGGVKWNPYTAKFTKNFRVSESVNLDKFPAIIDTDFLSGRGTLIPIKIIKKIGFFDEKNFPQYAADYDYSLRASKSGYRLIISTKSILYSKLEDTSYNSRKNTKTKFKNIFFSFFDIYSPNSIKVRFRFAKKNAKIWPVYFILSVLRLFFSKFIKAWWN